MNNRRPPLKFYEKQDILGGPRRWVSSSDSTRYEDSPWT